MSGANLTLNFNVPFPSRVQGAGSIQVTKQNGIYTVQQNYGLLAQHTPLQVDYPATFLETWNQGSGIYERMSLADLQEATQAGLPCAIEAVSDGGNQALQAGQWFIEVPYFMTINRVSILATAVGSIAYDIRRVVRADFNPPTRPNGGDTICGATPPTLVGGNSYLDTALTGWTTELAQNDILGIALISAVGISRATLAIQATRNLPP